MSAQQQDFQPFSQRMQAAGLPAIFIETFAHYYQQLVAGQTGLIPESNIRPVLELPDAEKLPANLRDFGAAALSQTAVIKLNGGLGTSMGLARAKSLLPVRGELTFLDVIARQAEAAGVPLILMNSFATDEDSLAHLSAYPGLRGDIPLSFLQHKEPKIRQDDWQPVLWPADPEQEWCPPGHGDIYTALLTSGTLTALLSAGYRYAFVSNADNLGAVIDPLILGYFAKNGFPFMMEVADRTEMDKKGGHLAHSVDGGFLLRESAQCPTVDEDSFQDITRHRFFNTNNLWINLGALEQVLAQKDGRLGLPMIRNAKTVDPRDPTSTAVYQLETAMGSAIAVFPGAQALRVPRSRFAPVKKTNDLLAVRSDAYTLTADQRIIANPARGGKSLLIELDADHYKFVGDLDARFPEGVPSLLDCTRLSIEGDFRFGQGVRVIGNVQLSNSLGRQAFIPGGTVLAGDFRAE